MPCYDLRNHIKRLRFLFLTFFFLIAYLSQVYSANNKFNLFNKPPKAVKISPSLSYLRPNVYETLISTCSDPDGYKDIAEVHVMINVGLNTIKGKYLWLYYNAAQNRLYIRDTASLRWIGGFAPGTKNIIKTPNGRLNCRATIVSRNSTNLVIQWNVAYSAMLTGEENVYVLVRDKANTTSGWKQLGRRIIDGTPPTGTITINNNAVNTNNLQVTLNLSVSDNISAMQYMQFSSDGTNWTDLELYKSTKNWTLSNGDGNKTVYVRYQDKAGNISRVYSDNILLDTTLPTGAISINNNAEYTNTNQITITLSANDNLTGVTQMQFSNDNATWSTPETYVTAKTWTPTAGDGTKTIYVKFKDGAGNWSSAVNDTIVLDTTPPQIQVTSPQNNFITNQRQVNISGTFTEENLKEITVNSQRAVIQGNNFSIQNLSLANEGDNQITIIATDLADNQTTQRINVILDTIPPQNSTTTINEGAYTNNTAINLTLSAEGASEMLISESTDFTGANWEPYATTKRWILSAGDGNKTIYIKYRDLAQNVTQPISCPIILDTIQPQIQITSPQNNLLTNQRQVNISGTFTEENLKEITINSQQAVIQGSNFSIQNIPLANEGDNAITVAAIDLAGNQNSQVINIIRDTMPPQNPTMTINEGEIINNPIIHLTLSVEGALEMIISERLDFGDSAWEPFIASKEYTLSVGKGRKTIYVKFRDSVQNETQNISAYLVFTPIITAVINSPQEGQTFVGVNIPILGTASAPGAFKKYTLAYGDSPTSSVWTNIATSLSPITNGQLGVLDITGMDKSPQTFCIKTYTVDNDTAVNYVTVNILNIYQLWITQKAFSPLKMDRDIALIAKCTQSVEWTIVISNHLGNIVRTFRNTGLQISQSWDGKDEAGNIVSDGVYTCSVEAVNEDRIRARPISDTIVVDTILPQNPVISIPANTNNRWVTVSLSAEGADQVILSDSPKFCNAEWQEYNTTKQYYLEGDDGPKTIYAKFQDNAGNETQTISATTSLDAFLEESKVSIKILEGRITAQPLVHFNIFTLGANRIKISEDNAFNDCDWQGFTPVKEYQLSNGAGQKVIYLKFFDTASGTESKLFFVNIEYNPLANQNLSILIKEGEYLKTHNVTLLLNAANVEEMIISEDMDFAGAEWQPFQPKKYFTLSPWNGSKTIYAKFKDSSGIETAIVSTQAEIIIPILLLDGENPAVYATNSRIRKDLLDMGYIFEYISLLQYSFSSVETLNTYDMVILTTYALDNIAEYISIPVLQSYLESGGRLCLASQNIVEMDGIDEFKRNYLHVTGADRYIGNLEDLILGDVPSGAFYRNGIRVKAWEVCLQDAKFYGITPDGVSEGILTDTNSVYYALRYPKQLGGERYRLVFFAFPVELGYIGYSRIINYDVVDFLIKHIYIDKLSVNFWYNQGKPCLKLEFSSNIDTATFTGQNVTLTGSISGNIPISVPYFAGRSVLISPSGVLNFTECYTLTINTNVKNIFGATLREPFVYTFTLSQLKGGLSIVSVLPTNNAENIPLNSRIWIQFDSELDPLTVNSSNILITSRLQGGINGVFNYDNASKLVEFVPAVNLPIDDIITINIATSLKSKQGAILDHSFASMFSTGSELDTNLPAITGFLFSPDWLGGTGGGCWGMGYFYECNSLPFRGTQSYINITAEFPEFCRYRIQVEDSTDNNIFKTFDGCGSSILLKWDGGGDAAYSYVEEGTHNVTLTAKDICGNESLPVRAVLNVDYTFPNNGSVTIERRQQTHDVNTELIYPEDVVSILIGEYKSYEDFYNGIDIVGIWESPSQHKIFTLSDGEGKKYVDVYFKDRAGNIVRYPAELYLDLSPSILDYEADPASISPNNDGVNDSTEITAGGSEPLKWELKIKNSNDQVIIPYNIIGYADFLHYKWNGKDSSDDIVPDGVYTYTITGKDDENNSAGLVTGTITVSTHAFSGGTIAIREAPAVNSRYVTLVLSCPDAVYMQISENNTFSGAVWQEFHENVDFNLSAGDGIKTIYARFRNSAGNTTQPVSANITLDTTPPVLPVINPITSPTDNPEQTITGTKSEDTVKINIYGPVQVTNLRYPTSTTWAADLKLQEGFNDISINAEDSLGNTSAEAKTTIYYSWNIQKPVVEITSPQNGAIVKTGEITGRVSDLSASVAVNGQSVLVSGQGVFSVNLRLQEGENTITVEATDRQGDVGTASIKVIYDTINPQIAITSPQNGAVANLTPVTITGTVDDANLSEVSVNMMPAVITGNGFTAEGIELDKGENTITAEAIDKAGNTAQASVTVTLNNEAPKFEIEEVSGSTMEMDLSQLPEIGSQHELKIKLKINDEPAVNEPIRFQVTEGQGQLSQQQVMTDADGEASVYLTLDTNAEHINKVTAYPVQCPQEKAEFIVMGRSAPSTVITKLTDETLTYVPNAEIELIIKLADRYNNPIQNEAINFTVLSGGGQLQQETAETNEMGEAYIGYTVGPTAGVVNRIKAELASNPTVSSTFNIQTIALPAGITVESIINKVKENDDKIQDIQADMVITSNMPWADPEVRLHIWQKGDKQKTHETYPGNDTYIRPQGSAIANTEGNFSQQIVSYSAGNNTYIIKSIYTSTDGRKSNNTVHIDYGKGIALKTVDVSTANYGRSTVTTEYNNWVQIPGAGNVWVYNNKTETSLTSFSPDVYVTTTTINNRQVNMGVPDGIFE